MHQPSTTAIGHSISPPTSTWKPAPRVRWLPLTVLSLFLLGPAAGCAALIGGAAGAGAGYVAGHEAGEEEAEEELDAHHHHDHDD